MKKFAISLLALAAVSTVALANENRGDLRDSNTYFGNYSNQVKDQSVSSDALAVIMRDHGQSLTSFERLLKVSEENQDGRN